MIAAGSLNRRVTVERRYPIRTDDLNATIGSWCVVLAAWAEKIAKSETETFDPKTKTLVASRTVVFRMRWSSEVTEADRIVCDQVAYEIRGIRELGHREGIEVTAEAMPLACLQASGEGA